MRACFERGLPVQEGAIPQMGLPTCTQLPSVFFCAQIPTYQGQASPSATMEDKSVSGVKFKMDLPNFISIKMAIQA